MKANIAKSGITLLAAVMAVSVLFFGCSKDEGTTAAAANSSTLKDAAVNYTQTENTSYLSSLTSLPAEELSEAEMEALIIMREEELVAHDVYLALSQIYTKPVFSNITRSEAVHAEAIRKLLVKYSVPDPAANHVAGTFTNPDLQELYTSLVATGSRSLLDGMIVGATIEDMDIFDLQNHLTEVDNQDIILVFNNLVAGSKNHLRAFYANILLLGGSYTPQYISLEEFNAIINQ